MVNLAATPAPRQMKEDFTKKLKYEQHYGRYKEEKTFEKGAIHAASLKAGNLSERLIKVLKEEKNLCVPNHGVMKPNYF